MSEDNIVPKERWLMQPGESKWQLTLESGPFYVRYKDTNRRLQHGMFRCQCGTLKEIGIYEVKQGRTKSCGCITLRRIQRDLRKGTLAQDGKKVCARCQREYDVGQFGYDRYQQDGLNVYCKDCKRDFELEREFGISIEEYNTLLLKQGGRCVCCGTSTPGNKRVRFAVDHCHKTGKIRGLLCFHCNTGLGHFFDSPKNLRKAAEYLEKSA